MNDWEEKYRALIWSIEQQEQPNGKIFERARRSPGTRLIVISDENQLLINREKRSELEGAWDLRLPGGKVFDDIEHWIENRDDKHAMLEQAKKAAAAEGHEECGLIIQPEDLEFLARDVNGGKGEWDLYYFIVRKFEIDPNGPAYHETEAEEIDGWDWLTPEAALPLALDVRNGMSESRSARYVAAWAQGFIG